ncbi:MAG: flagellar biosynthetic protein FliR, partial [Candidatus Zixiibacteriota bacterium]
MFEFINYSADKLILLFLIIIRTSGMFITSPFWGDRSIPALVKVGLIVLLSLILLPTIPNQSSFSEINSMWQLVGLAFNEMLIGFIIGLFFRLIFIGVMIAGTLIGYQMGFMFATMFDS